MFDYKILALRESDGDQKQNYGHNPKTYVLRNWSKLIKQNPKGTKLATEPFWIP